MSNRSRPPAHPMYLSCLLLLLLCSDLRAQDSESEYQTTTQGTRWLESPNGGLAIKVLVEESNLGSSEVELAEITFPAGSEGGNHRHGSIEIFYVLSGTMRHVVNGVPHEVRPGEVAIVKPGDVVSHEVTSDEPVRALVIWAPGGEAGRIARSFTQRPLER